VSVCVKEPGRRAGVSARALPRRLVFSVFAVLLALGLPALSAAAAPAPVYSLVDILFPDMDLGGRMDDAGAFIAVPPSDPFSPYGGVNTVPLDAQIDGYGSAWVSTGTLGDYGWSVGDFFGSGRPFDCGQHDGYLVACSPTDDGTGAAFGDGFNLFAFSFSSAFPGDLSGMYNYEVFLGADGDYVPYYPKDLFAYLGDAYVFRYVDGAWTDLEHLYYDDGSGTWMAQDHGARVAATDRAVVYAVPDPTAFAGVRVGIFKTRSDNPSQPDTVAALTFPEIPTDPELPFTHPDADREEIDLVSEDSGIVIIDETTIAPSTTAAPTTSTVPAIAPVTTVDTTGVEVAAAISRFWWWFLVVVGLGLSAMGLFWLWMYLRFMRRLHGYRRGIIHHLGTEPEPPAPEEDEAETATETEAEDSAAGRLVETEDGRLVYWPADTGPRITLGPASVADRKPTPPDCIHLRRRWQELRRDAVRLEYRIPVLRRAVERAQAACDAARHRVAEAAARLADLEPRTDAANYYTRMAWLQQELNAAQGDASVACAQIERAEADITDAEAAAEEARAEADAARAAYEACVKAAGS